MSHVPTVSKLLRYSLAFSALSGSAFAAGCSGAPQGEEGTPDDTTPVAEVTSALVASPDLVISQLYGGGGNTNAVYTNDFVEIFNRSAAAVSLQGKSIQYTSGTANFAAASNVVALPNVSVPAGHYFLVQLASGGAVGGALPTPDFTATGTTINMAKDKGKLALVDSAALLDGCGATATPCTAGNWIDLIGYGGSTANTSQFEGSAPAGLTANTTGVQRLGGGCQDTGDNGFDTQVQTPAARNSATAAVDCSTFDGGTPPPVDAGTDTGTVTDASTTPDTGTVTDASSGTDGSTVSDAGTKTDSGTKPKDGGTTTTDDSGTGSTSGGSDAGTTKKDAGKSTSAASSDTPTSSGDSGGCSVSTSNHSDSPLGLGAIGLALAAITRRRRKA